jgi:4'-phosphopantetheinyl transferase EntD
MEYCSSWFTTTMYTVSTSSAPTARLFPPEVVGVLALIGDVDSPHAEERRAVAGAGERRRREFLSGRACAHAALAGLGRDEGAIGVGPSRQPLWPAGVVGSISHAGAWAGAVVAPAAAVWAVGLDLEPLDPPLDFAVERLVGVRPDPADPYRSKLAFSAKECVYKCLFPATGWPLAFGDVTVELDPVAGRFSARVAAPYHHPPLEGRVVIHDGYLFTSLCLPRTGSGEAR